MSEESFKLQWYPGHMAKAKRELADLLKRVHFVIEVADARAPATTRNDTFETALCGRPRLLVLAKEDLADPGATRLWLARLRGEGLRVIAVSLRDARGTAQVRREVRRFARRIRPGPAASAALRKAGAHLPRFALQEARGIVVGVPNTGKSTLIRALGGKGVAVGARAGVTRGVQWVDAGEGVRLLDTPGLLWPRAERGEAALRLAWLGCVGEAAFDREEAGRHLLRWFALHRPEALASRYGWVQEIGAANDEILIHIARQRGCVDAGGRYDLGLAANLVLQDFREGRLGRVTLDPL